MSYAVQLLVLGAIWGGSFLFMRIAVNDFGPVPLVEMRLALVAGFAGIIVLASGKMAGMSVGWASIAGAAASLMYGLGAHMARRHLQGLLCTGIAFALFYRLIEKVGANRTAIVTYLIPPFGVAWGWLFLKEPVTVTMMIACVLILGSVALSQNWGAKR